jgi:putative acetyltransferase
MADFLIRPARPDDAAAIHEIRQQPEVRRFTSALPSERVTNSQKYLADLGGNAHLLVAEIDGRVVGMAGLHVREGRQRHSARVGLMVHDAFAGRGIGRALLEALLDVADNWLGLIRVDLDVYGDNERALRLYETLGFVEEGRLHKAYIREGKLHDGVLMARLRAP